MFITFYIIIFSVVGYISIMENDLSPQIDATVYFEQNNTNVTITIDEINNEFHDFEYISIYKLNNIDDYSNNMAKSQLIKDNMKEGDSHTLYDLECGSDMIYAFLENEKMVASYQINC